MNNTTKDGQTVEELLKPIIFLAYGSGWGWDDFWERADAQDIDWIRKGHYEFKQATQAIEQLIKERCKKAVADYIAPHLAYCQEQNGLPACKNCGLGQEYIGAEEAEAYEQAQQSSTKEAND